MILCIYYNICKIYSDLKSKSSATVCHQNIICKQIYKFKYRKMEE